MDYTTAHAIYHNKATRVDLATLDALARALGIEPGELLEREPAARGSVGAGKLLTRRGRR